MLAIGFGLLSRPAVRWGLAILGGFEVAVVAALYRIERVGLEARQNNVTYNTDGGPYFRKYPAKGLRTPPATKADNSGLDPSEEVVGVVFQGKARAYRLEALRDRDRHVVNDLVGGVPVSVVFCTISDCVRVYADENGTAPLDIRTAGLIRDEMVVQIGENYYMQLSGKPVTSEAAPSPESPPIPYASPLPQRMTWGEWRQRHPETDVFVGVPKRLGE